MEKKRKIVGICLVVLAVVIIFGWVVFFKLNYSGNEVGIVDNIQTEDTKSDVEYEKVDWTKENLPKIDCATAMKPLCAEIVKKLLNVETTEEAEKLFQCTTTNYAYPGLVEGDSDVIFLFEPSDEQIEFAAKSGISYEQTTIGYDAFVFVVNKDNPVDSISSDNLKKIYNGSITNWKELGGRDEKILAFQRNKSSGSQTLMEKFMGDVLLADIPEDYISIGMGDLIYAVADENQSNSIGYSVFYYASEMMANPNLKFVKVDGVEPTKETIANGTYPIINPVKAVIRNTEPADSLVRKLVKWCLTEEGQDVVEKGGYVKLEG